MIQSASAQRAKSSSKLPIAIFSASAAVKNAAGLDFFAASKPARTILLRSPAGASAGKFGGTMSSKMQGSPAFAKCAAIREPMVPAPSTTAFSMRRFIARLLIGFTMLGLFEGTGYRTGKRGSNGSLAHVDRNRIEEWQKRAKTAALSAGGERPRTSFAPPPLASRATRSGGHV